MPTDDSADSSSPTDAAEALERGRRLEASGHVAAARSAYDEARRSGNKREAATAALAIAEMLNKQGDRLNAEREYQTAAESGVSEIVPVAAFGLGMLRELSGDVDGAISAFRITAASGHQRFSADAWNSIGDLLSAKGEHAAARQAYEAAADFTGDAVAAARARLRIARLDYREGNRDAAKAVIEKVARTAPRPVALAAAFTLSQFLAREGKLNEARPWLIELRQSGDSIWAEKANGELRKLEEH